jgi:hypothetical protein
MSAVYSKTSPYYSTGLYGQFLDVMVDRSITKVASDQLFTITQVYHLRPNLLAYDLYKNAGLWWVFAQRNPNVLKDPLFDFVAGTSIYLPSLATLTSDLGL